MSTGSMTTILKWSLLCALVGSQELHYNPLSESWSYEVLWNTSINATFANVTFETKLYRLSEPLRVESSDALNIDVSLLFADPVDTIEESTSKGHNKLDDYQSISRARATFILDMVKNGSWYYRWSANEYRHYWTNSSNSIVFAKKYPTTATCPSADCFNPVEDPVTYNYPDGVCDEECMYFNCEYSGKSWQGGDCDPVIVDNVTEIEEKFESWFVKIQEKESISSGDWILALAWRQYAGTSGGYPGFWKMSYFDFSNAQMNEQSCAGGSVKGDDKFYWNNWYLSDRPKLPATEEVRHCSYLLSSASVTSEPQIVLSQGGTSNTVHANMSDVNARFISNISVAIADFLSTRRIVIPDIGLHWELRQSLSNVSRWLFIESSYFGFECDQVMVSNWNWAMHGAGVCERPLDSCMNHTLGKWPLSTYGIESFPYYPNFRFPTSPNESAIVLSNISKWSEDNISLRFQYLLPFVSNISIPNSFMTFKEPNACNYSLSASRIGPSSTLITGSFINCGTLAGVFWLDIVCEGSVLNSSTETVGVSGIGSWNITVGCQIVQVLQLRCAALPLWSVPCLWERNFTQAPTNAPSRAPSVSPTLAPSSAPSSSPSNTPTVSPTGAPTLNPTLSPSNSPSSVPSGHPSASPTVSPTDNPTNIPSGATVSPSAAPTVVPSHSPTVSPAIPASSPGPTASPTNIQCFRSVVNSSNGSCIIHSTLCRCPRKGDFIIDQTNEDVYYVSQHSHVCNTTKLSDIDVGSDGSPLIQEASDGSILVGSAITLASSWLEVEVLLGWDINVKQRAESSQTNATMRFKNLTLSEVDYTAFTDRIVQSLVANIGTSSDAFEITDLYNGSIVAKIRITGTASQESEEILRSVWNYVASQANTSVLGDPNLPFRTVDPFYFNGLTHSIVFTDCPYFYSKTFSYGSTVRVEWPAPKARNIDDEAVSVSQVAGPRSNERLAQGNYVVQYEAVSSSYSPEYCSFVVSVDKKTRGFLSISWGNDVVIIVAVAVFALVACVVAYKFIRPRCGSETQQIEESRSSIVALKKDFNSVVVPASGNEILHSGSANISQELASTDASGTDEQLQQKSGVESENPSQSVAADETSDNDF